VKISGRAAELSGKSSADLCPVLVTNVTTLAEISRRRIRECQAFANIKGRDRGAHVPQNM
jgi:hypothetical protein